jgi:biotin operon repressor
MLEIFEPKKARDLLTIILHVTYSDSKITIDDLAELCDISIASINRHLSELRNMGFKISSSANKGVEISNKIDDRIFKTIANEYLISRFSLPIINDSFTYEDLPNILGDKLIMKFLHAYANKLLINLTIKNYENESQIISSDPIDIFKYNDNIHFLYGKDSHIYICSFKNLKKIQLTNDRSENTYGDEIKSKREEFIEKENTRREKLIEKDKQKVISIMKEINISKEDLFDFLASINISSVTLNTSLEPDVIEKIHARFKREIEREVKRMKKAVDFSEKYYVDFKEAEEKEREEEIEKDRIEEELRIKKVIEEEKRQKEYQRKKEELHAYIEREKSIKEENNLHREEIKKECETNRFVINNIFKKLISSIKK